MTQHPLVQHFFDEQTNTFSYVVVDPISRKCAVIDSVLDYDAASATTKTTNADLIVNYIQENSLSVEWILETEQTLCAYSYWGRGAHGHAAVRHRAGQVAPF